MFLCYIVSMPFSSSYVVFVLDKTPAGFYRKKNKRVCFYHWKKKKGPKNNYQADLSQNVKFTAFQQASINTSFLILLYLTVI